MQLTLVVVAAILAFAVSLSSAAPFRVSLDRAPHLRVLARAAPSDVVRFRVLLRQPAEGVARLREVVEEVSTPGHPRYGRYLGRAEVEALTAAPDADTRRVLRWLRERGATSAVAAGDYVRAEATAEAAEAMWKTELSWVEGVSELGDRSGPRLVASSGGYAVPPELEDAVERVTGFAETGLRRRYGRVLEPSPSQLVVVPQTLAALYNFEGRNCSAGGASQQVIEFVEDGYSKSDMSKYLSGLGLPKSVLGQGVNLKGDAKGEPDGEGALDIQLIVPVGAGANSTYWALSNGWIIDVAQDLLALDSPPLVNSISWGSGEWDEEDHARTETELAKLGARGVTVLAASGDSGAVGTGQCSGNQHTFTPSFPATSAFVLSVGATQLQQASGKPLDLPACSQFYAGCASGGTEAPADQPDGSAGDGFATGGGFSVYNPRPSWQADAVSAYLQDSSIPKPPAAAFNASNRGYPDVAAMGNSIVLYMKDNDGWITEGGTSASTPIWGGMLSIINSHLYAQGKQPVGFVNPLLYKIAAEDSGAFSAVGSLKTNNKDGCPHGYVSGTGEWSPVTGLGVPNLGRILAYVDAHLDMFADRA